MAPASVATHKTEFQTSQLTQLKQLTQLTRLEGDYISHETQRVKRLGICRGTCESIPVTSVGIKKIMFKTLTLKSRHFCLWIKSIPQNRQTSLSISNRHRSLHKVQENADIDLPKSTGETWRNMAKPSDSSRAPSMSEPLDPALPEKAWSKPHLCQICQEFSHHFHKPPAQSAHVRPESVTKVPRASLVVSGRRWKTWMSQRPWNCSWICWS